MARQKSEDRVLLEGGVMPVERAGSSSGRHGKAIPVEQTAGQLRLPIATAENRSSCRFRGSGETVWEWWAESGEGEHGECDQGLGCVEAEGAAGDQPDLGVDRFDACV